MKHIGIFAALSVALCAAFSTGTGCGGGSSGSSGSGMGGSSTSSSSTSGTGGASSGASSNSSSGTSTSSGSSTSSGTSTSSGSSSSSGSPFPPVPTIGTQIDRIGRPAVNTALNHSFDGTSAAGPAKDMYNQDSNPANWKTNYAAQFATNLGIIDALDGTCGNQLGYAVASNYTVLGGALTDDRLYLNTAGTTSARYLAVEVAALSGATNTDQGGRTLSYVVMDTTYSALAAGAYPATPVSNGITSNNVPFLATFPYEAAPNELADGGTSDAGASDAGDGG